jgi:hypothetical protein
MLALEKNGEMNYFSGFIRTVQLPLHCKQNAEYDKVNKKNEV